MRCRLRKSVHPARRSLARRLSWYAIAPIFIVLMSSAVSASMSNSQNRENQANVGQLLTDTGAFSVKHTQLGVIAMNQTGSRSPCLVWNSTACVAAGGLSAGQWLILVELQLNTVPISNGTYAVSVQIDSDGPVLQPIEFIVTNSTISGSTGNFYWDLGTSFSTPLAFTVSVSNV
jgi:hypothetical protein